MRRNAPLPKGQDEDEESIICRQSIIDKINTLFNPKKLGTFFFHIKFWSVEREVPIEVERNVKPNTLIITIARAHNSIYEAFTNLLIDASYVSFDNFSKIK